MRSHLVGYKGGFRYGWRVRFRIWEPICEVIVIVLDKVFHFSESDITIRIGHMAGVALYFLSELHCARLDLSKKEFPGQKSGS